MKKNKDIAERQLFQMAKREKMILPETLYARIDETLAGLPEQKKLFKMTWKKSIILAAALLAMFSVTASAAVSAWRQRMEAMNAQEMEDYFVQIYTDKIGVDNYNRPYTDTEKNRMKELRIAYEGEALFPDGALTMISDADEYKGKGVAFLGSTATFFFPEKEMSDEELLQIIDFQYKRDYSLQKMNEMIEEGEIEFPGEKIAQAQEAEIVATDEAVLESNAVWDPAQELTIPYTGNLKISYMAAGQDCIFLTGENVIHKMEIGGSDSELFFDDFDRKTYVSALYQDKKGDVYVAVYEETDGENYCAIVGDEKYAKALYILSPEGEIKKKIDLSVYQDDMRGIISRMVVDDQGYIYLRATFMGNNLMKVLDSEGNFVKDIPMSLESKFYPHGAAGLGIGKDGRVYTQLLAGTDAGRSMGIGAVNLEKGCIEDIYMDIVPEDTIMLDIIAAGADTDFVFWGYSGIFNYNLGEESAVNILPAYEAQMQWEGVLYCALPDGRIVFGDCTEWQHDEDPEKGAHRIPEKTCFYYKTGMRNP